MEQDGRGGMQDDQSNAPLLRMRSITKRFPGVTALKDVDVRLDRGEVLAIVGENGAGKSTLMKIIAGVHRADDGSVFLGGREVAFATPQDAKRLGITMVFQDLAVFPHLSVAENIAIGTGQMKKAVNRVGLLNRSTIQQRASELLEEFGCSISATATVRELRVGERQVVELARALNDEAKILILDEPTSALEDAERQRLFHYIRSLRDRGVGILYVSHRLEECLQIGDRIAVLRDGEKVAGLPTSQAELDEVIELMVGHSLQEHFPKREIPIGDELLRVEGLSREKKFHDISFALRRGEILGLAGLPDSGKFEVGRALFGAEPHDSGRILIDGKAVNPRDPAAACRAGIAFLAADRKSEGLFLDHSVKVNMTIANLDDVAQGLLRPGRETEVCRKYIDKLSIKTPSQQQRVRNLSGGNQQKVVVARWLYTDPRILILEEPTRGIDVGAKVEVFELVAQFVASGGAAIIISSELPELVGMCDRTIVMRDGGLVTTLDRTETTEHRLQRYIVHRAGESCNANK